MKSSIRFKFIIATLFFFFVSSVWAGDLAVHVSPQKVLLGESVLLQLDFTSRKRVPVEAPDLEGLAKDFDLIGRHQSYSAKQVNDDYQIMVSFVYKLMPKHEGKLIIPSFDFYGERSDEQIVYVGDVVEEKTFVSKDSENMRDSQEELISKEIDSHHAVFWVGSILFILGGILFVIAGILILFRKKK
ncbi:MAG: BatD family protein [Alphaproteobacteria bacterium]|nr:BatD family protein [Alphaproteobacteria bacterium]